MRQSAKWDKKIDLANTQSLKRIIKTHGFPTRSLVGEEAFHGVWLLVQHADHDIVFQKYVLELLIALADQNEADKPDVAFLTDRVLVNSGEAQIFGTQFFINSHGEFKPRPIANSSELDVRRSAYGLEPFHEYEALLMHRQRQLDSKTDI